MEWKGRKTVVSVPPTHPRHGPGMRRSILRGSRRERDNTVVLGHRIDEDNGEDNDNDNDNDNPHPTPFFIAQSHHLQDGSLLYNTVDTYS